MKMKFALSQLSLTSQDVCCIRSLGCVRPLLWGNWFRIYFRVGESASGVVNINV